MQSSISPLEVCTRKNRCKTKQQSVFLRLEGVLCQDISQGSISVSPVLIVLFII